MHPAPPHDQAAGNDHAFRSGRQGLRQLLQKTALSADNVLSRPTSSRFSRTRLASDVSFRQLTLPTLETFRRTFGDCGCKTWEGHRSYVSYNDRNMFKVSGSLQSFSARCKHYSSPFGFCEFMDFPSLGTIETEALPPTHCGWAKPGTNRLYLSERTADASDLDNQISFTSNLCKRSDPGKAGDWYKRSFLRSLRLAVTFIPSCTPICSSQESAAEREGCEWVAFSLLTYFPVLLRFFRSQP